jgi:hypothetical protein
MEIIQAKPVDVMVLISISKTEMKHLQKAIKRAIIAFNDDDADADSYRFFKKDFSEFIDNSLKQLKQNGY